jgi:hypothetical protein
MDGTHITPGRIRYGVRFEFDGALWFGHATPFNYGWTR